ncbi:MAG: YjbQ family protein [Thermoplasmata archaeon]|nr:MAG: YjbQ family protein [Thermoplasmata archaeon]
MVELIEFTISTSKQRDIIDITDKIEKRIDFNKGVCIVHVPHATAGLIINEYEPNIKQDYLTFFENLTKGENYKHNKIDNNAEAHLLSALVGPSKHFIVKDKRLVLGTWQRVLLCEFDGPRTRKIVIHLQK